MLEWLAHLAAQTGAQRDDTLVVFLQQIMVNTWLVVVALKVGSRAQFHQVLVAGIVHRQQDEVVTCLVLGRVAVMNGPSRHIGLDTNDRFDARVLGYFVKLDSSAERPMVGDGTRLHAQFFDMVH